MARRTPGEIEKYRKQAKTVWEKSYELAEAMITNLREVVPMPEVTNFDPYDSASLTARIAFLLATANTNVNSRSNKNPDLQPFFNKNFTSATTNASEMYPELPAHLKIKGTTESCVETISDIADEIVAINSWHQTQSLRDHSLKMAMPLLIYRLESTKAGFC